MKAELNIPMVIYEQKKLINNLDLQEYIDGFKYAKRIDQKLS